MEIEKTKYDSNDNDTNTESQQLHNIKGKRRVIPLTSDHLLSLHFSSFHFAQQACVSTSRSTD